MRYTWWMAAILVVATGCAMPSMPGLPLRWSQKAPTNQVAAPAKQEPGLTDKVASYLHLPGTKSKAAPTPAQVAQRKTDPIALGFPSGPPTPELYVSMAEMSDRCGNSAHALSMYQKALAMQPNHVEALLGLARMEDREGRMDMALRYYHQAVTTNPQSAKAFNDLALCQARNGQLAASLQALDQAIRLQPDKPLYRNNIAKVLLELNRVDEAVSHLAAVHPPAVAQYNMGVLMQQRGRKQEAIRFLTAATHIDPQLQEARKLLFELQGNNASFAVNDGVLPTPITRGNHVVGSVPSSQYQATSYTAQRPAPQTFPAQTSQVPVGYSPMTLPPVR